MKENKRNVQLFFEDKPYISNENYIVYGSPLNENLTDLIETEKYTEIIGVFLIIITNGEKTKFVTDVYSGYKCYYSKIDDVFYVSDSIIKLKEVFGADFTINKQNNKYYLNHGFCLWDKTPFNNIFTIPSCVISDLDSHVSYFDKEPKLLSLSSAIISQFKAIGNRKAVLMFSGGSDSCYLARLLIDSGISVDLVFIESQPKYKANERDRKRAITSAKTLGLDLYILKVSLENGFEKPDIIREMYPNKHTALLHSAGCRAIRKVFGNEIVLVNGQSADSILTLGPSERNIQDLLRRMSLNKFTFPVVNTIVPVVNKLFGTRFSRSQDFADIGLRVLDERRYFFLKSDEDEGYISNLRDQERLIRSAWSDTCFKDIARIMKINSFLQGPDNEIVIKSSKVSEIRYVLMPFANANLLHAISEGNIKDIFSPKKSVRTSSKQYKKTSLDRKSKISYFDFTDESSNTEFNVLKRRVNACYEKFHLDMLNKL